MAVNENVLKQTTTLDKLQTGKVRLWNSFPTKDLNANHVLSFAEAVLSLQHVAALVLPDGFRDGNLGLQSRLIHLVTNSLINST